MDRTTRRIVARYGFAPLAVAITLPMKLYVIDGMLGTVSPYLLFFLPVILTAWWAGARPGVVAVALNAIACAYFHHEPLHTLRVEDPREALLLSVFIVEGLLVCWLMGRLHGARARAEEALRARETFLAMVGHELRMPLNPVLIEATARLDDPATPPGLRPAFERIRRGAELEGRLIDDLLDAVRLGHGLGRSACRLEPIDAHEVVLRALDACRSDWEARKQSVSVDLAARAHRVRADGVRLQQVIWNLVRNASKFSPSGGLIAVRSADEPGGGLVIEVVDKGVGIAPEDLDAIFAPFAQGVATAGRFGGLGLGLAICRSIVEAHGGRLEASSAGPGRGATFTLRLDALPASSEAGPATGSVGVPEPGTRPIPGRPEIEPGRNLLVVDDDETTAGLLAELFRHDGYEVVVAHTVSEAMAAPLGGIDCVISDLDLPDGTGVDLLRLLRDHTDAPVVVLSGYDPGDFLPAEDETDRFAARLVKPVDYPALEATIRATIEQASAVGR